MSPRKSAKVNTKSKRTIQKEMGDFNTYELNYFLNVYSDAIKENNMQHPLENLQGLMNLYLKLTPKDQLKLFDPFHKVCSDLIVLLMRMHSTAWPLP